MNWETNKIVSDIKSLIGNNATVSTENNPQGERYCRDIFIETGIDEDGISIIGFNTDDISDVDNPTEDIEQVEIRNFWSDSDGGLLTSDKEIRRLYFIVVDYFSDKNIEVVDNLRDYF